MDKLTLTNVKMASHEILQNVANIFFYIKNRVTNMNLLSLEMTKLTNQKSKIIMFKMEKLTFW